MWNLSQITRQTALPLGREHLPMIIGQELDAADLLWCQLSLCLNWSMMMWLVIWVCLQERAVYRKTRQTSWLTWWMLGTMFVLLAQQASMVWSGMRILLEFLSGDG